MSAEGRPAETVVARLRPHARALFWPSVALIAIAGASVYVFSAYRTSWIGLAAAGLGLVLAIVLWLLPLLSWLARNYTITTRRIVLRSGLLVRQRREILHSRGYDVTVRTAGLQSLFGSGTVSINTGLENPVVLHDVPHARLVQAALSELMEENATVIGARRQQEESRPPDETVRWGVR